MAMLSFDNPTFQKFAFYSGVVIGKTLLMGALTVRARLTHKIFSNPEDASTFGGKEMIGDESVERIRRCHQNDIENVFPFVLVGSFYLVTEPDPWWASLLFRTFAVSRCLHTVCYMAPVPQPSRFLCCLTGWGVTAVMTVLVLRAAKP
ncbi:microsomal glutathione S-transferase 1-like [Crassostrea virginica]|uniref:Microsomal glutathione S-transferase 1 n=1 Tax=Crassostrea virginica TaxID=6565 RepID=A0A8B8CQA8_CRAVI|nr:microsomal glutathione S-transferase 1-like [Crassostrea virginica]|mmetsp:Transcript_22942/g.36559  ORF Transcript_22942/g.36559 Transcript_22942/m.36559 type:complete len:148 (-) Transcript_22942:112-555(-)